LSQEAVNLLEYKNGYLANAKVVKTQDDLIGTLLNSFS
jgi:flagellar hook-associated protein FlgK